MNKKFVFLIILILLLLAGGIFWWWERGKEVQEEKITYSKPGDFIVEETPEGKIIINKKEGFKTKVPEGWKVKEIMAEDINKGAISLCTPDVEIEPKEFLGKGCWIEIGVEYGEKNFKEVETMIKIVKEEPSEKYSILTVRGQPALKEIFSSPPTIHYFIVKIPLENKVFYFYTTFSVQDIEKCSEGFDRLLNTVSFE